MSNRIVYKRHRTNYREAKDIMPAKPKAAMEKYKLAGERVEAPLSLGCPVVLAGKLADVVGEVALTLKR